VDLYPKSQFNFSDELVSMNNVLSNDAKAETISHVDFDQLVHRLSEMDITSIEYFEGLMARFQTCQASIRKLDSSHHAVVRAYLALGQAPRLLDLLSRKFEYGLFLDFASANLLMAHFLGCGQLDNASAALFELLCQEELGRCPLNLALGLRVCAEQLQRALDSDASFPALPAADDDQEDVALAVDVIRNAHYDDHWDVVCPKLRLGKCLLELGRALEATQPRDMGVARTCQLLGAVLYEKLHLLEGLVGDLEKGGALCADTLRLVDWAFDCVVELLPSDDESRRPGHVPRWSESELAAHRARWDAQLEGDLRRRVAANCADVTLCAALKVLAEQQLAQPAETRVAALYDAFADERHGAWAAQSAVRQRAAAETRVKVALRGLLDREERLRYFEEKELRAVREAAWRAPRTAQERAASPASEKARDLANLSEQSRRTTVDYEPLDYS